MAVLTTLLASAFSALAQEPLSIFRNYFVTGDYVVGGVGLQGLGDGTGFATGTINIPDQVQPNAKQVPAGADIVAAFLYWQTVESAKFPLAGQNGFLNGFAISGTPLPSSSQAPVSWSTGGCSGSANGTKVLNTYRADVRPYLNFDALGRVVGNGSYVVKLRDSGSNGGGVPLTLGATLVVIYRVVSPAVPLKSIVIYDGDFAPVNQASNMSQDISGFYDAADSPVSEITQIVGNGQPNKLESVSLNGANLASLYGAGVAPFPGKYNGSWDNPTWPGPGAPVTSVQAGSAQVNTLVMPNTSNSGCVVWGAVIFGTTVQDTDNDGLLNSWESGQGYTDVMTGRWVPLPGADPNTKDVYVNLDYLTNLDGSAGPYIHSHLPKQKAIDQVGDAFKNAPVDCDAQGLNCKGVRVHFDLGVDSNGHQIYPGDAYVIADTGHNAIPESAILCQDSQAGLCQFPGQVATGWKNGLLYLENFAVSPNTNPPVGYFDPARKDSYHYVLFGHALGLARSYWTAYAASLANNSSMTQLTSIVVNSANNPNATVTLQTPTDNGACAPPNVSQGCPIYPGESLQAGQPGFGDTNLDRVTITDAINFPVLNGVYSFSNASSSTSGNVTTTTFRITTVNVPNGTYTFANEPRLAVLFAGPNSSSGHSDVGGADSLITFGLWPADDPGGPPPICQPDPSVQLNSGQDYCINEVGTVQAQAGTLMHEIGHSFTLTHGGTYYANANNNPSTPPTYGVNCKSNYESVMNYLFQIRGFPDGAIDYSRQTFQNLFENALSESTGIGVDSSGHVALHPTRWFAPPNSFDKMLGNRTALAHCDGTPLAIGEAGEVRVDGPANPADVPAGTVITNSSPIDWNNDLMTPNGTWPIDASFDGQIASSTSNPPTPLLGFNDWQSTAGAFATTAVDFRQIGSRGGAAGYSGGGTPGDLIGGGTPGDLIGGGITGDLIGGGTPGDLIGGGVTGDLIGGGTPGDLIGGGTPGDLIGGGTEVDYDIANSTVDPATGLSANMVNKAVVLTWSPPGFGQIRSYLVYRLLGTFNPVTNPLTNAQLVATVKGAPPKTTATDASVKNKTTYTYFVVAQLGNGRQSPVSNGAVIFVVF
jgi:hypothetical protein